MNLLLFWLKIALRRMIYLVKRSPVIFVGAIIIIAAFIVARNDIDITLSTQTLAMAVSFLVFCSLLFSSKSYHTMPLLMMYSKSRLHNKTIHVLFFVGRAVINNTLMIVFGIILLKGMVKTESFAMVPIAAILSIFLSFLLMYLRNEYAGRRIRKTAVVKAKIDPFVKSAIYDYFTSEFLQTTVISTGLFVVVAVMLIGNIRFLHELENPSIIFTGILIILSLGFMGIIESIPNINWKFHAIVFPQGFIFHIKRIMLFLGVFFGLQMAVFIFVAVFFGLPLLVKYLYCLVVMLLLSINIAFMVSGRLIKAIVLLLAAAFTVWVSALHAAFLPLLILPVLLTFAKARSEYTEWYLL